MNPRGQVAPQVHVSTATPPIWAEGGRWRRSRHLRRVQRPRQGGTENGPSRRRMPGGTPFFERWFHEITNEFYSESVQKLAGKKWHRQTRRHADRSGRSGAALGPCSGQPKRRYQSQNLKKLSPKPSLNPAKIPVKEHLRLASVVALSSSGACGAINNPAEFFELYSSKLADKPQSLYW